MSSEEDLIRAAISDKEKGIDISEKYDSIKQKYSSVFKLIDSGEIFKNPNYKEDIDFMLEQRKIYKTNKFQADKAVGMKLAPMLGDKFNDLSKKDLEKAEKKALKKSQNT